MTSQGYPYMVGLTYRRLPTLRDLFSLDRLKGYGILSQPSGFLPTGWRISQELIEYHMTLGPIWDFCRPHLASRSNTNTSLSIYADYSIVMTYDRWLLTD